MKLHLPTALLFAVISAMTAEAVSFLAEGVNANNISQSERFFDTGKGHYWQYEPLSGVNQLYNSTGGYQFLGTLENRIDKAGAPTAATFAPLAEDGFTCGYQVAANVLDYWQSYYGVFYTGQSPLTYGYTYDPAYREALGSTQSSALGLLFYDTWKDAGNHLAWAAGWYLNGRGKPDLMKPGASAGGYYADYFGTAAAYDNTNNVNTLAMLKDGLFCGFDLVAAQDGSLQQADVGRIVYLGLASDETSLTHALTCYGFTLDKDGKPVSLSVANSDDRKLALETVYLKEEKGHVYLYSDAACTVRWKYSNSSWRVDSMAHLVTPDLLKRLYAEYSAAETPLTWTGQGRLWSEKMAPASSSALPTANSGWDVRLSHGTYHSYYVSGRPVVFDDSAKLSDVLISGDLHTSAMWLNNSSLHYVFTGIDDATTIYANSVHLTGAGNVTFSRVNLNTKDDVHIDGHTVTFNNGSVLTAGKCMIDAHGELIIDSGSTAKADTITVNNLGKLNLVTGSTLDLKGGLILGDGADMIFTVTDPDTPVVTHKGPLYINGHVDIELAGNLEEGRTYALVRHDGLLDVSHVSDDFLKNLHSDFGTVFLAQGESETDNVLYMTYKALKELSWAPGSGKWSKSLWKTAAVDTTMGNVKFTSGTGTVTVSGTVQPHTINLSGGTYTFSGTGGAIQCACDMTLTNTAAIVLNVPMTAKNIYVFHKAALTFNKGFVSPVSYIHSDEGSTVSFNGSGITYDLPDIVAMNGTINIGAGTTLNFHGKHDHLINGTFVSSATNSVISFNNAADDDDVTYEITSPDDKFKGRINIGTGSGLGITLMMSHLLNAATYQVAKEGRLVLHESGSFTTTIGGNGTVEISRDCHLTFHKNSLGADLALMVNGLAEIGSPVDLVSSFKLHNLTITTPTAVDYAAKSPSAGSALDIYLADGAKLAYDNMALDGGTYTYYKDFINDGVYDSQYQTVGTMKIGSGGGNVYHNHVGAATVDQFFRTDIGTLSGTGNLLLGGSYFAGLTHYTIANASAYSGNLTLVNELQKGLLSGGHANQVTLDIKGGRISGVVTLRGDSEYRNRGNARVMLGIGGDVTIGGLVSEADAPIYLYSGELNSFHGTKNGTYVALAAEETVTPSAHTLTINTKGNHTFNGKVLGSLSLSKSGTGTQTFAGDMTAFNGNVTVSGGTLNINNSFSSPNVVLNKGTALGTQGTAKVTKVLTAKGAQLSAAKLAAVSADFTGSNGITANTVSVSGTCTLNVEETNASAPVLSLGSLSGTGALTLGTLNIKYSKEPTPGQTYRLLQYTADFGTNPLSSAAVFNDGKQVSIGGTYLYITSSVVGGKQVYTLQLTQPLISSLTWTGKAGDRLWNFTSVNWAQGTYNSACENEIALTFGDAGAGTVTLSGSLAPKSVLVSNSAGNNYVWKGAGKLISGMKLTKSGAGSLTLNSTNTYTGGTVINAGTVNAGGAASFGTGTITVKGGTLNLGSYAVANNITVAGSSNLKGTAYQGALTINGNLGAATKISLAKTATLAKGTVNGVLTGTAGVKVTGEATLAAANTYTGTTAVAAGGLLHLTGTVAGNIAVSGTLDGTARAITLGSGKTLTVNDGGVQKGTITVNSGGTFMVKGKKSVTGSITLNSGTVAFDSTAASCVLTGNGVISSNGHKMTVKTKATVKSAAATALTLHSGTFTLGSVNNYTGTITLGGGTLNLGSLAAVNAVKVTGGANLKATGYKGALTIAANMGTGTIISLAKTATLAKGKITGVLTGSAGVNVTGEVTLAGKNTYKGTTAVAAGGLLHLTGSVAGNYSVAGTLDASQKAIALGKGKAMTVADGGVVMGKVTVNSGATLTVKGTKSKLGTTVVNGGTVVINSTAATVQTTGAGVVTVKGKKMTLNDVKNTLKMAAAESVTLNSGKLTISSTSAGYTGYLAANGGTLDLANRVVKNNVYLGNAVLAHAGGLKGALYVQNANARFNGSLTLTSNSELNFTPGSKLAVSGTLALNGGTTLRLNGSWKAGTYTLMTSKLLTAKSGTAFRVAGASGLALSMRSEGNNVILKLAPYVATAAAPAVRAAAAPAVCAAAAVDSEPETPATETLATAELPEEEVTREILEPVYDAAPLMAAVQPAADALVQADWAVVDAARAFTSGIRNRSTGTLTPDGKGAVWMNAIGSLARHSSVNGHSGSQVNLYGGAVGVEHNIGEHHSIGAAVGGTHANIGNTPMGKLRQNTTHVALYGNSRMGSKFSADWAAAFGSTNAHGNLGDARAKWQQNSTELSARLTYKENLTDSMQLRTFAGLDYDATNADRTNGGKTGSVQALRGEFGMGLTHATDTYSLYGEVGMVGDMVRHNPVAEANGFRLKGANPGRIGLKATLGGSIRLNDTWSANASYNLETAADATMQSVNVGASRKF